MKPTVGSRIREIRKSKGISATFVANKLGVHPSTIGKYETGERGVDADFLPKIAKVLGVDVGVFFTHELDETSNKIETAV